MIFSSYNTAFQGKIVGRGILFDYDSYIESQGMYYIPIEQYLITAKELEARTETGSYSDKVTFCLFVWVMSIGITVAPTQNSAKRR